MLHIQLIRLKNHKKPTYTFLQSPLLPTKPHKPTLKLLTIPTKKRKINFTHIPKHHTNPIKKLLYKTKLLCYTTIVHRFIIPNHISTNHSPTVHILLKILTTY